MDKKLEIITLTTSSILNSGDKVICLLGFHQDPNSSLYGGAGYTENHIFTVKERVTITANNTVVWINEREGLGIFAKALGKVKYLSTIEIYTKSIKKELI